MKTISIQSPAKVNLYLEVLGRRRDGYHELLTIFHRISLRDQLILRKITRPQFRLVTRSDKNPLTLTLSPFAKGESVHRQIRLTDESASGGQGRGKGGGASRLPSVKRNLIYCAYCKLKPFLPKNCSVEVTLKKRIPIAAGLGGGSSNAAHFILGMNQLFKLGLSQKKLVKLGAELGSDVPFFLYDVNQAIGSGRGEKIKSLPAKNRFWFVLAVSRYGIPTSLVYRRFKAPALTRISRDATITSVFLKQLKEGHLDRILRNDLYQASLAIRPELKDIDALFEQLGVRQRLMSGSGPTMFSIHKSKREAERIARLIERRRGGVKVFVCHTY